MTDLVVRETSNLDGVIMAPPSKAYTHRAIIATSLSQGRSSIENPLICEDTLSTINACSLLGAKIKKNAKRLQVYGTGKLSTPRDIINCRDSGTTLRFMTAVCTLADGISILTGSENLRRRPMKPLLSALRQLGVRCYSTRGDGCPPLTVFGGGITGGIASIRGDVSSQFISALLLTTPKAYTDTEIIVTTRLESLPYVAITLGVLEKHKVKIESSPNYEQFLVPSGQVFVSCDHLIEGDYSSASFILAAASITDSYVKITNLRKETLQGDKLIVRILKEMGSQVRVGENYVEVNGAEEGLKGIQIDLHDAPDMAPICVVLGCFAKGETVIKGIKRLRFKESDRVVSVSEELRKMGGNIREYKDKLVIEGEKKITGTELDSHKDHRVAMAFAVAALKAEGTTTIHGIESINKSYPNFVEDLRSLGGKVLVR